MRWIKRDNLAFLFVVLGIVLLIATPRASAQSFSSTGNPDDNPSGEGLSVLGTEETLNYVDANDNTKPTTYPADDVTYTISPEYGFSGIGNVLDYTVDLGELVTHEDYAATNEGNADDTYTFKFLYHTHEATNWTVEVWENNNSLYVTTLTEESQFVTNRSVTDESHKFFNLRVLVPDNENDAPDSSNIHIYTTVETSNVPAGQYHGGNALTYGGTSSAYDEIVDSVSAPQMAITRVATIDAPIDYAGGHYDPVPGAIITFTMTYSNEGGASAESVVLIDRVPVNTSLAHINTTGITTYVTIEAAQGDATDWTVFYTTEADISDPARKAYDAAGWILIGTLEVATTSFPGGGLTWVSPEATWEATYVKWQKNSIPTTEAGKKLTWGVTIR